MQALLPIAEKIAGVLIARHETIAVAESSTGGLIAAALLSVPGASAYFVGGAVVYTKVARVALLDIGDADMQGLRPATEAYSLLVAWRCKAGACTSIFAEAMPPDGEALTERVVSGNTAM